MALPRNAAILFSLLNMKLRDQYASLEALCDDLDEDQQEITRLMAEAGYCYDAENNQFVPV